MYFGMLLLLIGSSLAVSAEFQISIESMVELPCKDCDGVALGDISGNGKMDILSSSGEHGEVFWFKQGDDYRKWTKHPIYDLAPIQGEIEGNDLADFDGDGRLEAVSLDQPNGRILLHKCLDITSNTWETAVLRTDRPYIQASLVDDINGDDTMDLVYTWEGAEKDQGGVHVLRFTGDNVLNPEHWEDTPLIIHESAWWLVPQRVDMNSNGYPHDIVYTARNIKRRNPGARPGVYWLELSQTAGIGPVRHVIDDTLPHPLHIDMGDLSGGGHGKDIVVGGFDTTTIYWYERDEQWRRHEIPLPETVNDIVPNRVWNVKSFPVPGNRDALLAPVTDSDQGALLCFEYLNGAYRPNTLLELDYTHPMDDRVLLYDLSGNGIPEAIIPDSGPRINRLLIISFSVNKVQR